ncbi:MAG TPA: hypothetical protein VNN07_08140 [Candidatus Tectomicrobia bacterium]|nr:hypothetical protein [Candidatus Tectomicrobia bacterium]
MDWHGRVVEVDVTREQVRNTPRYEPAGRVDRPFETRLHGHYGRPGYWDREPRAWRRPA